MREQVEVGQLAGSNPEMLFHILLVLRRGNRNRRDKGRGEAGLWGKLEYKGNLSLFISASN